MPKREISIVPPVHPVFVHYPIALGATSVLADTLALVARLPSLLVFGQWSITIAAAGAVIAAIAGYWDMKRGDLAQETHELVHLHLKSGLVLLAALLVAAVWRWSLEEPTLLYLVFAWILLAGTALQAWMGGEIVYAHGGGVAAAGQGTASEEEAKKPSRKLYSFVTGNNKAARKNDG
jgi:uncharacterized membrane protein